MLALNERATVPFGDLRAALALTDSNLSQQVKLLEKALRDVEKGYEGRRRGLGS